MKEFIDPLGYFRFYIPSNWHYMNNKYNVDENSNLHTFERDEDSPGCFQISYTKLTKERIKKLGYIVQNGLQDHDFQEINTSTEGTGFIIWIATTQHGILKGQYIGSEEKEKYQIELKKARKVLKSITLSRNKKEQQQWIKEDKLKSFLSSLAASIDLSNRSQKKGAFIETIILLSNQIDALLRLNLILLKQINENSDEIDISLIFQNSGEKPLMEKSIYQLALENKIINQDTYEILFNLYNDRNKAVHRYIITNIQTNDILYTAIKYNNIIDRLREITKENENLQYKKNIGIYKNTPNQKDFDKTTKKMIINQIKQKHGNKRINQFISVKP